MYVNFLFVCAFFCFIVKDSGAEDVGNCSQFFLNANNAKSCAPVIDSSWKITISELANLLPSISNEVKKPDLGVASIDNFLQMYPVILSMPPEKLSKISGLSAANLLVIFNNDTALTSNLLSALITESQRTQFLKTLSGTKLSHEVQGEMCKAVVYWPPGISYPYFLDRKNPTLIYLPPEFLFNLTTLNIEDTFYFFKTLDDSCKMSDIWLNYPDIIKRTWSKLLIQHRFVPLEIWNFDSGNRLNFILLGMNLEELDQLGLRTGSSPKQVLYFSWNAVQIRMLFDKITDGNPANFLDSGTLQKNGFLFLPRHYQQFSKDNLNQMSQIINSQEISSTLSSTLQLFEYMKTNESTNLASYKLLYSKSPTYLNRFCNKSLSWQTMRDIQNEKYTRMQSYYVTGCGTMVNKTSLIKTKAFEAGFLNSIPASYFATSRENINDNIFSHLILHSDGTNVPFSAAILQFINKPFTNELFYIDFLRNINNGIISLISPSEVFSNSHKIRQNLISAEQKGLTSRIQRLPRFILSPLLYKEGNLVWKDMYGTEQRNLVLGGLTCDIVYKIPSTDFISILSLYNRQRASFNQVFPKDLQRCVQIAVISYLKWKTEIYNAGYVGKNLISNLHLSDIKAIGGYVLASFPVEMIFESKYYEEILREIGKLSLPELINAMSKQHFENLVSRLISKMQNGVPIGLKQLIMLQNLIHFIPSESLPSIDTDAFKFILESNYIDTRICADNNTRHIWGELIQKTFGGGETWKSDTILILKDMLITVPQAVIKSVRASEWLNIADLLKSGYNDRISSNVNVVPFYKACGSTMTTEESQIYVSDISKLIMYYLIAIQNQLSTIKTFPEISTTKDVLNNPSSSKKFEYSTSTEIIDNNRKHNISTTEFLKPFSDVTTPLKISTTPKFLEINPVTISAVLNSTIDDKIPNIIYEKQNTSSTSSVNITAQTLHALSLTSEKIQNENSKILLMEDTITTNKEEMDSENTGKSTIPDFETNLSKFTTNSVLFTGFEIADTEMNKNLKLAINLTTADYTNSKVEENSSITKMITETENTTKPYFEINYSTIPSMMSTKFEITSELITDENYNSATDISSTTKFTLSWLELFFPSVTKNKFSLTTNGTINKHPTIEDNSNFESTVKNIDSLNFESNMSKIENSTSIIKAENLIQVTTSDKFSESSTISEIHSSKIYEENKIPLSESVVNNSTYDHATTPTKVASDLMEYSTKDIEFSTISEQTSPGNFTSNFTDKITLTETTDIQNSSIKTSTYDDNVAFTNLDMSSKKFEYSTSSENNILTTEFLKPFLDITSSLTSTTPKFLEINPVSNSEVLNSTIDDKISNLDLLSVDNKQLLSNNENITNYNNSKIDFNEGFQNLSKNENPIQLSKIQKHLELSTTTTTTIEELKNLYRSNAEELLELDVNPTSSSKFYNYDTENNTKFENESKIHRKREQNGRISQYDDLSKEKLNFSENYFRSDYLNLKAKMSNIKKIKINDYSNAEILEILRILNLTQMEPLKPRKKLCRSKKKIRNTPREKRSISNIFNRAIKIQCNALRTLGEVSGLAMSLIDISLMDPNEIFDCLELFGTMELTPAQKMHIWNTVKEKKLYHVLGGIINAIEPAELKHFDFNITSDWALEILYFFSENANDQKMNRPIINKFLKDNQKYLLGKSLPYPAVIALGHLTCNLDGHLLSNIFKDLERLTQFWTVLHRIRGCPIKCLEKLAQIAVNVMGPPNTWSAFVFSSLGPVPSGLEENTWLSLVNLNTTFTRHLSPLAVECLSDDKLKSLTENHLSELSPDVASILNLRQRKILSKSQQNVIDDIVNMKIDKYLIIDTKNASSSKSGNKPVIYYSISVVIMVITFSLFGHYIII